MPRNDGISFKFILLDCFVPRNDGIFFKLILLDCFVPRNDGILLNRITTVQVCDATEATFVFYSLDKKIKKSSTNHQAN